MNGGRILATFMAIFVAAALHQALASRLVIFGARPDFLLVVTAVFSMFTKPVGGILTGALAGVFQGALPTANIAHYTISRALTGFAVAGSTGLRLQPTIGLAAATAALATIFAQLIWMFIAAPSNIGAFLGDTIRTAMYNGVLAMPLYALLRKIFGAPLH